MCTADTTGTPRARAQVTAAWPRNSGAETCTRCGSNASRSRRGLAGRHVIVTAGPTHEPIDPVRYIANRSSGRQGFAIAQALAAEGARVTLIAGPVALPTPAGVDRVDVVTALEMAAAKVLGPAIWSAKLLSIG